MLTDDPWLSNLPELEEACGPVKAIPARNKFVKLWKTATTDPASLFHRQGSFEVLRLEDDEDLDGILICPEYRKVWDDIVAYYSGAAFKFETPADPIDNVGGDSSSEDPLSGTPAVSSDPPISTMDDHPIGGPHDLGQWTKRLEAAVIITGHPGIGKSIWLRYALARCLIQGRTILFQNEPGFAYLFNDHGVFSIGSGVQSGALKICLPSTTWCLVDSNEYLLAVPKFIRKLSLFIVQAASPCIDRMRWSQKASNFTAMRYVMKPMTAQELIAGVSLQKSVPAMDPNLLVEFVENYGPSTREAYKVVSKTDSGYVKELTENIAQLDYPTISKMLGQTKILDVRHDGLSHKILFIRPSASRDAVRVDIITKHVFDMIHQAHLSSWRQTSSDLYRLFLETPHTRASAGYFLEDACHAMLPAGGQWDVTLLEQAFSTATRITWKTQPQPTHRLLIGWEGCTLDVTTQARHKPASYMHLPEYVYRSKHALKLEDGYYRPMSKNEPTLDSFIYDSSSDTITIFQITVSETQPVNLEGFAWLGELKGAGKASKSIIDYVAVTPNKEFTLPLTHPANKMVRSWYHLQVEHLPFLNDEGKEDSGKGTKRQRSGDRRDGC